VDVLATKALDADPTGSQPPQPPAARWPRALSHPPDGWPARQARMLEAQTMAVLPS
jgi:hypothetical protein